MAKVIGIGRPDVRRLLVVAVFALALSAALAPRARADGDPASDYLQGNQVFLASQAGPPTASQRRLLATVRTVNHRGFAVRVAIVGSAYDLGSITALWHRPELYARFLGLELSGVYRGRLLVVMPNGLGFYRPGHPAVVPAALARIGSAPGDLAASATTAVRALARTAGVSLTPPSAPSSGPGPVLYGLIGLVVLGLVGGPLVWRRRGPPASCPPAERAPSGPGGHRAATPIVAPAPATLAMATPAPSTASVSAAVTSRSGRGWLAPALATGVALAVAVAAGVLLLEQGSGSAPAVNSASIITPPPVSWAAGARPAPNFSLRDQYGRAVSVSALRGHPVVVTFVDPLCRALCPLEAHVLNAAVARMPADQRPTILAVSVDRWADTPSDLLQDERQWSLVPQWHWAVGRPAALASVWRQYQIGVKVVTKHIAQTTINYITHTEAAYIVDASGHERALFLWPFYPQDVVHVLRGLGT